ncbi:hypothetical protein K402DRAFT_403332 [Aulographum hederae CBS 113979]|uniref:BTB domain-containing protein n=1 Tax=Aulographum hederae CBS 113979 TaxID=1176131 RepID=A0A6G1H3J2_9PEZI|nr:hypothetical protein K402DRAFT_403332 [Aulographum hederae CBS 113979]
MAAMSGESQQWLATLLIKLTSDHSNEVWTVPRVVLFHHDIFIPGLLSDPPKDLSPLDTSFQIQSPAHSPKVAAMLMNWLSWGRLWPKNRFGMHRPDPPRQTKTYVDECWTLVQVATKLNDTKLFNAYVPILLKCGHKPSSSLAEICHEALRLKPHEPKHPLWALTARAVAQRSLAEGMDIMEADLLKVFTTYPGSLSKVVSEIKIFLRRRNAEYSDDTDEEEEQYLQSLYYLGENWRNEREKTPKK